MKEKLDDHIVETKRYDQEENNIHHSKDAVNFGFCGKF